eukprot:tig00020960_g16608.t1
MQCGIRPNLLNLGTAVAAVRAHADVRGTAINVGELVTSLRALGSPFSQLLDTDTVSPQSFGSRLHPAAAVPRGR